LIAHILESIHCGEQWFLYLAFLATVTVTNNKHSSSGNTKIY